MTDEGVARLSTRLGQPRLRPLEGEEIVLTSHLLLCEDCGALVMDNAAWAHTRFHSILSGHAWALAVLKTAHIGAHVHDRYDVPERIDSKRFDNWSGDAFKEVTGLDPGGES